MKISAFQYQKQLINIFLHLINNIKMKKVPNLSSEKPSDNKINKKSHQQFKFELSSHNLACFKGKQIPIKSKCKMETIKDSKNIVNRKSELKISELPKSVQLPCKERIKNASIENNFNQQVVFMQYDNIEVYIDNSNQKRMNEERSQSLEDKKKSQTILEIDEHIASACVRVITEETDASNNFYRTPSSLTPRSDCYRPEELYEQYYSLNRQIGSKMEGNKSYIIDFDNIEGDGRTTVMIKNIPIRYNQQTLLSEFSENYQYTFDFFYLPIDKNSDCNVGYAFVNFLNSSFLKAFYLEFHNKKWTRYKSMKICNICYARCQGTLELANHFRHSKVLQQKDRKLKPLIGISEANNKRSIEQIIRIQKERE